MCFPSSSEVPWLQTVQTAPRNPPAQSPPLSPLLVDDDGRTIETLQAWHAHRAAIRQRWLDMLNPASDWAHVAPKLDVIAEDRAEGVSRKLVRYPTGPRSWTDAYLLVPQACRKPTAGVVVFHSTVDESIEEPAAVESTSPRALGWQFAKRGFVAICPRNFLWPDTRRLAMRWQTFKHRCRHPQSTGMARMLHEAILALNVLDGLPQVDSSRLGTVGHSLGAKEALYLAAFDDRIRVAASNEGGIGLRFSNWDAPWYLGRQIRKRFDRDHHELLALTAPRAFLLLGGNGYDGDQSWPFIEAVLPVYGLYGGIARVGLFNHRQGHAFPNEAGHRIYEWFETYLLADDDSTTAKHEA